MMHIIRLLVLFTMTPSIWASDLFKIANETEIPKPIHVYYSRTGGGKPIERKYTLNKGEVKSLPLREAYAAGQPKVDTLSNIDVQSGTYKMASIKINDFLRGLLEKGEAYLAIVKTPEKHQVIVALTEKGPRDFNFAKLQALVANPVRPYTPKQETKVEMQPAVRGNEPEQKASQAESSLSSSSSSSASGSNVPTMPSAPGGPRTMPQQPPRQNVNQ